ncbi:hypothetical protein KXX16_001130 [Aspergillus fumigatus]|nr:hypothetical protein KXX30_008467 [Aspergillus fumigatus]KAH1376342.1 hypothetical protein KXX50_000489 [Aspergillus fumigatus]KAH1392531.1 hypothetical protein KXX49_001516 [Aspergillus fumigatus]KAH1410822.1 hypothetical protein KXX22_009035 [Aspergillus fumigatus]KAH1420871.1 hypothetical protein KXX64_000429 [Aspergillus fumigatus]
MRAPISLLCLFAQTSCLVCLWSSFALIQGVAASRHDPSGVVYEAAAPPPLARRQDLQYFAGALGGAAPAVRSIGDSERPYGVSGNTFTDFESAAQRSCNEQFDSCQKIANTDRSASFSLQDCQDQLKRCMSVSTAQAMAAGINHPDSASDTTAGPIAQTTIPYDDEFDLVCDL